MKEPIVSIIVGLNVLASLVAFNRPQFFQRLLLSPIAVLRDKEWGRLIGHAFIHGGFLHLVVNMFVLYMFGRNVEKIFSELFGPIGGGTLFIILYFGGLLVASLPALIKHANDPHYRAVGASGAVAAVLFAHILIMPTETLIIFPIPIPIPSFLFGILYVAYERYMEKRTEDNIAHDAHLWGAIYGFVFTIICKPALLGHFVSSIGDYMSSWG